MGWFSTVARSNRFQFIRTTRANLNAQASANALFYGEPYLITDEKRLAIGLSANSYQDFKAPIIQSVNIGASTGTVTPTFADDMVSVTFSIAFSTVTLANPSGTAMDGWGMVVRLVYADVGTINLSYGTQYRAVGVTLPTSINTPQTVYLGMVYNAGATKWDVVSVQKT